VTEEPEEVQKQKRVAPAGGIEKGRSEVAVGQKHGNRAGQDRYCDQQHESSDKLSPNEKRHFMQRHARSAHVEDRGDEVYGAQNRRGAREMQREDHHVDGRPGLSDTRERRIERPTGSSTIADKRRTHQQREGWYQQPKAEIVEPGEGHVGRADQQRYEPIAETADQCRHQCEENHRQAVGRDHYVVELMVTMQEKSSVKELRKILGQKSTPKEVKQRIEESIKVLI